MASTTAPNADLRDAIFRHGTSQADIARRAKIHETKLSRIVRGWITPTDEERRRLAKALRMPVTDLFRDEAKAS